MTESERRPLSSSTSESMAPEQSVQIDFQRGRGIAAMSISMSYTREPLTSAVAAQFAICKSSTEPLPIAYMLPAGTHPSFSVKI